MSTAQQPLDRHLLDSQLLDSQLLNGQLLDERNRGKLPRPPQSWHDYAAQAARPVGPPTGAQNAHPIYRASQPRHPTREPEPDQPEPEPDQKAKLLADWQLVKRARFQAADRLGRRNGASLFTLSMVALYGGLITVFVLIFKDNLSSHARNICDWVSAVANWLTLTFSLTEQIKDYSGQSRALHECAQKVNDMRKRLQVTPISAPQQLIPYVKDYEACISACGPNHDRLDYEIARYSGGRALDGLNAAAVAAKLRRLRAWSKFTTYAIYALMCAAPALAGLLAWLLVPVATVK